MSDDDEEDATLTPAERMAARRAERLSKVLAQARTMPKPETKERRQPRRPSRLPPPPPPDPEDLKMLGIPVAPRKPDPAPVEDPPAQAAPVTVPPLILGEAETRRIDPQTPPPSPEETSPQEAEARPTAPQADAAAEVLRPLFGAGRVPNTDPAEPTEPARDSVHRLVRPALLHLEGVHADIGRYRILQGVDLEVPGLGVTMLLGRNGVGKTTTLRTIMGLLRARAGHVRFEDRDLTRLPATSIARAGVGYVPENMGIFGDLTVEENMRLGAISGRADTARTDWILSIFPALRTFWRSPAGTLSGGQKQMLAISRVMVERRQLYLIDEPTKGLAPAIVSTLIDALRELKREGATILMVEQNFAVARALGDTCAVMDDGRIVWSGAMAALAEDPALQERLMGLALETGG